jgi:hypothetical protein
MSADELLTDLRAVHGDKLLSVDLELSDALETAVENAKNGVEG